MMSRLHKIYLAIVAVLVLGVLWLAHAHSVTLARAEEAQKATDKVLAAKDQALLDRDKAFQDLRADLLRQIADIKTAKQAVTVLQPIVQGAGQIAPQQVTKADLPPAVQAQLPGDAGTHYTLFTDPQMVLLGQREKTCQLTESGLTKCEADKADMQAKIDSLTAANANWQRVGAVGPWMAFAGVTKDAAGKGYSPALLFGRRITNSIGLMAGVQGNGDLTAGITVNFGGKR